MLCPMNKYLSVSLLEEEKTSSGVLVPDDFKANTNAYSLAKIIKCHKASSLKPGMKIIVPTHMVEQVKLFGENYNLVLENHVLGCFED